MFAKLVQRVQPAARVHAGAATGWQWQKVLEAPTCIRVLAQLHVLAAHQAMHADEHTVQLRHPLLGELGVGDGRCHALGAARGGRHAVTTGLRGGTRRGCHTQRAQARCRQGLSSCCCRHGVVRDGADVAEVGVLHVCCLRLCPFCQGLLRQDGLLALHAPHPPGQVSQPGIPLSCGAATVRHLQCQGVGVSVGGCGNGDSGGGRILCSPWSRPVGWSARPYPGSAAHSTWLQCCCQHPSRTPPSLLTPCEHTRWTDQRSTAQKHEIRVSGAECNLLQLLMMVSR